MADLQQLQITKAVPVEFSLLKDQSRQPLDIRGTWDGNDDGALISFDEKLKVIGVHCRVKVMNEFI
jgi:hypothetical protein